MTTVGAAIEAAYREHVPPNFARAVVRVISGAYKTAYITSEEFEQLMPDRYGNERRLQIELGLRDLPNRLEGLEARIASNETGTAHHVELIFGNIILTVEKIPSRGARLRGTRYQRTLAGRAQQSLFPELAEDHTDGYYYGVIVHSPSQDRKSVPEFIDIVFPSADLLLYFARFDLLAANQVSAQESDDLQLRLKINTAERKRHA